MRIGFDAKRYFHNETGLGNFSRSLINGFAELYPEHDYVLFSPSAPADFHNDKLEVVTRRRFHPFWRQLGIATDIERKLIDVYHGLSAELPYFTPQKTPMVVTIHDLIFMKYPEYYSTTDRFIYAQKTSHSIKHAHVVVASSERTKRDLEDLIGHTSSKIQVIYQDCDPVFYKRAEASELESVKNKYKLPASYFLTVSKFEKRKNHIRLIEAYQQSGINIPLILVGKQGDIYSELIAKIEQLGLQDRVTVLTNIPTNELPVLYQLATGSIFPSEYEGFGIPVLESLAGGTPVLTSANSSMEEIGGNACHYFNPLDVESMSAAIQQFSDTALLNQLSSNIGERLPHFSNASLLQQHLNIYQSLTQ